MNRENDFKVVPFPEIEAKYGVEMQNYTSKIYFQNIPTADYIFGDPNNNTFAVFEGDTHLKNLDLTILGVGLEQPQNRAVLVIGNLEVDETINMFGSDVGYPMYLYVTGNITAQNIMISQLADFIALGDIFLSQNLIALDLSGGQLSCYGNFSAKNIYTENFTPKIAKKISVDNFYYYCDAEYEKDEVFEELKAKIENWESVPFIRCGETGIAYFDKMGKIYTGEIDTNKLSDTENEVIEQLFINHRIFVPQFYNRSSGINIHKIDELIFKGENIFKAN